MTLFLLALLSWQTDAWQFTDVTQEAGVTWDHSYNGSGDPVFIASGAASADIDGDGWEDLYVLGGQDQPNALFCNLGNGTFENIAEQAGVASPSGFDAGAAFADVDGDGHLDLFVGAVNGSPTLYRNKGDRTFEDITAQAGLNLSGSTFSAAFADTDRDGDLDLFVTHWQSGNQNFFFENDGSGRFTNITLKAGFGDHFRPDLSFTPNFADLNGDHWPDLLVASDLGHSQVFLNDRQGGFVEVTDEVITDENGMGASIGDYDNDGYLDWFVSSVSPAAPGASKRGITGNRLYRGLGNGHFEDVTEISGVRDGFWGWAASFADFNNDAFLDIYHTNGFLGPFAPGYGEDPSRMFVNQGNGTFSEQSTELGLNDPYQGRGVVCFDYDRDGDLDIFQSNNGRSGMLLRNDGGNSRNWLRVNLVGHAPNSAAIGARIQLTANGTTQLREIRAGNNFLSQDPHFAHFGMGSANSAKLTITWPDGSVQEFNGISANRELTYHQPAKLATYCSEESIRWITHVTALQSDFQTRLQAVNLGQTHGLADLVAYDAAGNTLASETLALDAGEMQTFTASDLFGDADVSHLAVYAPQQVVVTAGYRLAAGNTSTAHVHETQESRTVFYAYPGEWDIVYDGLALINTSDGPIQVTAALLDQNGTTLASEVLQSALPARGKLLSAFNLIFPDGGHLIRIETDGAAQTMFLRGTHAAIEPALLFQQKALPLPQ